jgi:hypothetical protein
MRWAWPWRREEKHCTPVVTRGPNNHSKGYSNIAAILHSDEVFSIYRNSGYLQPRLLLSKQDDLGRFEQKSQELETAMSRENKNRLCHRQISGTGVKAYRELPEDI